MTKSKKIILILCISVAGACGTGIGNGINDPTAGPTPSPIENPLYFNAVINEYNHSDFADCGFFNENSSSNIINNGRDCLRSALDTCTESKYLYDKRNASGSRFTSFVSIESTGPGTCQIRVHTVSNVQPGNIGDQEATCLAFEEGQIPEVACGIGD